jgi:hypothetical protein
MSAASPESRLTGYNFPAPAPGGDLLMIHLFDQDSGARVGTITEDQLQFLVDQLAEESPHDTGYYITRDTLELFEHNEADPALLAVLRTALGTRDDMEIRWERR